jgi:hypothetical protein
MQVKKYNLRLIGRREHVSFPLLGIFNIEAKIDTGAYTSSLHCEDISVITESDKSVLKFTIAQPGSNDTKTFYFNEFTKKKIKNSFGEMEERYIIRSIVVIGKKKIKSNLSLSNRDNMRYPVLIGRKLIKGKFLIDPNQVHVGGKKIKEEIKK